jgi:transposase
MLPRRNQVSRRKRRKFTAEQKAEAVRVVRELGSVAQAARDLDLTESCLGRWVKQAEIDDGRGSSGDLTSDEREELRRLRRQVRVLEQERSFLKKAAAYFAEDTINERGSS